VIRTKLYTVLLMWVYCSLLTIEVAGQLQPQNSLYLVDLYQINPAYAGLDRSLSVNFNYRDQWGGIIQKPTQVYMNAHLPVYLIDGGVGVALHSDRIGPTNFTSFKVSYNRIQQYESGLLSGGLSLGYTGAQLNGNQLVTPEGIYQQGSIDHQDPILIENTIRGSSFNYNLGVFAASEVGEIGINYSNLFLPSLSLGESNLKTPGVMGLFVRKPYQINSLILYPSVYLKTDFTSTQIDLSCITKNGNVFGGLSLRGFSERSFDSLVFLLGLEMNTNYTLFYSYDLGISDLSTVHQGTHEVNLTLNLNKLIGIGLPPEIIYNPRNL